MTHFSYFGILMWFSILEQFTPIPEEAALVSLGYICAHQNLNLFVAGVLSVTGLLIADSALFFISLKGTALTTRLFPKSDTKVIRQMKSHFAANPGRAIVISALLPKVRFLSPIIAASSGIPWTRYIAVNGLVTIAYVTFYVAAGLFFYKQLEAFSMVLKAWRHLIFAVLVVLAAVFLIYRNARRKSKNSGPVGDGPGLLS